MASTVQANTITNAAGTGAPNFTNGLTASGTSTLVNANFSGNITLPTSGGTASNLNYYEEYTESHAVSGAFSDTSTLQIVRIGKQVTINVPGYSGTASGSSNTYGSSTPIPSRFRPVGSHTFQLVTYQAGAATSSDIFTGVVQIDPSGNLSFFKTVGSIVSGSNFSATVSGNFRLCITYLLA
jgi:hypothetical protein